MDRVDSFMPSPLFGRGGLELRSLLSEIKPKIEQQIDQDLHEFRESVDVVEAEFQGEFEDAYLEMWNATNGLSGLFQANEWSVETEDQLSMPEPKLQQDPPESQAALTNSNKEPTVKEVAKSPARYTPVEVKALVHAKLRLQLLNSFGENSQSEENQLRNMYLDYLRQLDSKGFEEYPRREGTALLRKFKSLKSKGTQLVEYFDGSLDNGLWLHMKKLISEPLMNSKTKRKSGGKSIKKPGSTKRRKMLEARSD